MKKKVFSLLCSFLLIITTFVQPIMAQNSSIISFEEVKTAMVDKYAEYGIEFEIEQTDSNAIFTTEQLSAELKKIDKYGQNYVKYRSEQNKQMTQLCENKIQTLREESSSILRSPVYGYTTGSSDDWISHPDLFTSGTCQIRTTAMFYCDFQYNTILTAYKPTLEVRQALGSYDDYVKLIDYTVSINNSSTNLYKHYAIYCMTIELKQIMNSPVGTIGWAKVERSHWANIYPFK